MGLIMDQIKSSIAFSIALFCEFMGFVLGACAIFRTRFINLLY